MKRPPSEAELARTALPDASLEDPRIGKLIGDRYRIVRLLGQGGMGAVYEAEHTLIRRRVALKFLHGGLSTDPKVVKRFQNEAIAATSIGNPHIVEVTDMGRLDDGSFYMALELLDGQELSRLLDRGPLTIGRAVAIGSQICDGLTAAHRAGIVHRDLKPDNIFLVTRDDREHVKILDFGIAKLRGEDELGMTATGHAMGTPYYMPPEQARGAKDADHRADLYSLGVILFECLAGQCPFQAESMPMLMVKILQDAPPSVRDFRRDIPDGLAHLIDRLLSKEPGMRPASAEEIKHTLARFEGVNTSPAVTSDPPPITRVGEAPAVAETRPMGGVSAPVVRVAAETPAPHSTAAPPVGEATPATSEQPNRWPLLGALAVGLVAAIGGVGLWLGGAFTTAEPPEVAAEIDGVPPLETPPEPVGADPAPESVRLQIVTEPPDARLTLDGEEIPNPFDAELEVSDSPRRVVAQLAGYEESTRQLSGRYSQNVSIALVAAAPESSRRARRGRAEERPPPVAGPSPPSPQPLPPERPTTTPPEDELNRVRF